jgi:hypothetical protein
MMVHIDLWEQQPYHSFTICCSHNYVLDWIHHGCEWGVNIRKGKDLFMKIPQGFEKFYAKDDVWLLLKPLYQSNQANKGIFGWYYCVLLKRLDLNIFVLILVCIISGIMVC